MSESTHNLDTVAGRISSKIERAAAELAATPEPSGDPDARLRERMARSLGVSSRKPKAQQADDDATDDTGSAKPKGPSVADIRRMRRQAESELAELREHQRDHARQRKALAGARARAEEAERLRQEDPAEYIKRHTGKGLREVITSAYNFGKLTPESRAAHAENADLKRALRAEDQAKTARQLEAAQGKAQAAIADLFSGVVQEAELTPAETRRVHTRAYRHSLAYFHQHGRAPSVDEMDRAASQWPEFRDLAASKRRPSVAAKPTPKAAPKAKPSTPKTIEDKVREAARGLRLK